MPVVVVTITQPAGTVTATPATSGNSSSLSAGIVAGIIIGTLIGGILFITLVLYLLNRYHRRKFARVANPAHDDAPHLRHLPGISSNFFTRHSQRPSTSSEPLMSPIHWPPLPATSHVQSQATLPVLPGIEDGQYSSFDLAEIDHVIASGTVSRSTTPARQASSVSLPRDLGDTPPQTRQASGDDATSPPTPSQSHQTLFLHRMLKSRAQASEGVSLARLASLDFSPSRSTTLDSSDVHGDEQRLLAEAERTALRDAEADHREEEEMVEEEEGLEEVESAGSIYSQVSAPIDHVLEPVSRQNSSLSMPRRKSSQKQARTPVPSTELPPVVEIPDTPRALEGQAVSRPVSAAATSSLDVQASHGTHSRPMPSLIDQSGGTLPLLTSVNFGKDSTMSGTSAGSISSTAGWGSNSSGRASRYPSLAASSIMQSSRSGPHSDAGTDWHHPPSGLAGLTSLQMGPMHNPHSPVEERPEQPDMLRADPTPVKRARLREGTVSSIPEVERRDVMQGGIARIDVTL